jgi:hypothetical protein
MPGARPRTLGARRDPTISLMMKLILAVAIAIASAAAPAAILPASAGETQRDGQLPMYPSAKLDPREASLTPAAISQGVPMVLLTADSVRKVDAWYVSHAPRGCNRQEAAGGVKYACPGGSIMIYTHEGQTQVALIPPMPKL